MFGGLHVKQLNELGVDLRGSGASVPEKLRSTICAFNRHGYNMDVYHVDFCIIIKRLKKGEMVHVAKDFINTNGECAG